MNKDQSILNERHPNGCLSFINGTHGNGITLTIKTNAAELPLVLRGICIFATFIMNYHYLNYTT